MDLPSIGRRKLWPNSIASTTEADLVLRMSSTYPHDEVKLAEARRVLQRKARDHTRIPMQWSSEPNAGFCAPDVVPWMRVNDDYRTYNAATQVSDDNADGNGPSIYNFWKRSLEYRNANQRLIYGGFALLEEENDRLIAYRRFVDDEVFVTLLNFSGQELEWTLPEAY